LLLETLQPLKVCCATKQLVRGVAGNVPGLTAVLGEIAQSWIIAVGGQIFTRIEGSRDADKDLQNVTLQRDTMNKLVKQCVK
jgi:hypothetical protein